MRDAREVCESDTAAKGRWAATVRERLEVSDGKLMKNLTALTEGDLD